MKTRSCYAVRPAHCLLAVLLSGGGGAAADDVTGLKVQRTPDNTKWRVQWDTVAGERYRLQKSGNLSQWSDVTEITAAGTAAQHDDPGVTGASRTFWRVTPLGEALNVSSVVASYQLGDTASKAMLQVTVEGAEPADTVVFFDNGVALGNAVPGQGDTWTFDLLWDGRSPQPGSISAEVTGAGGTQRTTAVKRFLLADPAKYVPLGPDGKPAYGEFVPMNDQGELGAFHFYPEGFADAVKSSGAHFVFPSGATMQFPGGTAEIHFTSGAFHRGHRDPAPLNAAPGPRALPVDSILPETVAAALGLPPGTAIPLLWGPVALHWRSGALAVNGWAALQVDLPLGDIQFPGTRSNASVTFNPATGEASLVVCFSGDWNPFGSGPAFRIPPSDPLKIYLDTRGRFSASGTAEAEFSNGSVVRGSLSWRDPYFEFRFQGRGLTIPALSSLRQVLPDDPAQCVPAGAGEAELDEAARCLAAFRDSFRQLATGGGGQGDPAAQGTQSAPLATAEDPAASALAGWAARMESWDADRAGQVLDTAALAALRGAVDNAVKLAVSAHDAPTVLKIARDLLSLSRTVPNHSGASPEAVALGTALTSALPNIFAAAKRVAASLSPDAPPGDLAEAARLLSQWAVANPARAPRGGDPAAIEARLQAEDLVRSTYGTFFDEFDIQDEDFDGTDNAVLFGILSADELIEIVERAKTLLDLLRTAHPGTVTTLDTAPVDFPMEELVSQAHVWVTDRHNAFCAEALARGELGPLVAAVRQRVRIFELYSDLGFPVPAKGADFVPSVQELALAMEEPFSKQLGTVSRELRLNLVKSQAEVLRKAASFLNNQDLNDYLNATWVKLSNVNSEIASLIFGAPDCNELERVLTNSFGFRLRPLADTDEGTRNLPLNGKYESVSGVKTLQLNQAGRYLSGHYQTHSLVPNGGTSHRSRVEGILMTDTPSKVEYAFVLYSETQPASISAGVLSAELDAGAQRLNVTMRRTFPRENIFTDQFRQISNTPFLPASVVTAFGSRFGGEAHRIVKALAENPLHTRQLTRLLQEVPDIIAKLDEFAALEPESPAAAAISSQFDGLMERIKGEIVTVQQLPLARVVLQQVLSKARPVNSTRTYWEQLVLMMINHDNVLDTTRQMTGSFLNTPFSADTFTYTCTISADGIGRDFKVLKLGGLLVKIHLVKTGPGGTEIFDLIGLAGQGGAGFESNPDPENGGGGKNGGLPELPIEKLELEAETIVVNSPFDYRPEDLRGPIFGFSGEANFGLELKIPEFAGVSIDLVSVDGSGLALFGTGALPPLILTKEPEFQGPEAPEVEDNPESGEIEFKSGTEASIDAMVGYVTDEGDPLAFLADPLPFRFEASVGSESEGAVFFDTDSDVIRPCGRQFLRRLVAEYAGVFVSTNPKIRIIGMTDTAGTLEHNDDLSLRRAKSVRDALLEIAGPLGFEPEDILAIGLGEEAAVSSGSNPNAGLEPEDMRAFGIPPASQSPPLVFPNTRTESLASSEPWLLELIRRRQAALGRIPDETGGEAGARWRSVVVLINNVAALELTDPGDLAQ